MNKPRTPRTLLSPQAQHDLTFLAREAPHGAIVEIGVYRGGSAFLLSEIARERDVPLYLFDTFTGIPQQGPDDPHPVGDFCDTSAETVGRLIPTATIIEGVFPKTLFELPEPLEPVGFCHVDCDQHDATYDACRLIPQMMLPGGIMLFDDYGALPGATRAFDNVFGAAVEKTAEGKAIARIK